MPISYPYPSHVCAPSFVTVKLSGWDMYDVWKTQMQCLLKGYDMFGFIDGTFENPRHSVLGKEKENDYMLWEKSDALVKGWILGSLSEHALSYIVNHLKANDDFSAKDVWDNVKTTYCHPPVHQQEITDDSGHFNSTMSIMYPYPSHVCASSFVTVKLSDKEMYGVWKTQMECLLTSHDMHYFIDGTFRDPRLYILRKATQEEYILWIRSDTLVKGWILGSLSEHTLRHVVKNINEDFRAANVWDKVHKMYGPSRIHQHAVTAASDLDDNGMERREATRTEEGRYKKKYSEVEEKKIKEKERIHKEVYNAILDQSVGKVLDLMKTYKLELTDKLTINGNTALHLAVSTTKNTQLLTKMLEERLIDGTQLIVQNSDGSTPLHVAAIIGNTEAAKILVSKNKDLLLVKDNEDQSPLARAVSNMHSETYLYLLAAETNFLDTVMNDLASGTDELVANAISSKDFESAWRLFENYVPIDNDALLMAMSQNFPPELNIWEKMAYKISHGNITRQYYYEFADWDHDRNKNRRVWIYPLFANVWPLNSLILKVDLYLTASKLLKVICYFINGIVGPKVPNYFNQFIANPIFEATRQNAYEVVEIMVGIFPDAIWCENEDGHNIIQYAIVNRSEKIYNLLHRMREQKNIYKTIKDSSGNNLLHLAARLAPPNKLNFISGAALQIQSELQWFEEVKKFVCPLNVTQKNSFDETPSMVFTREHKDLVVEGEKWMKGTAESYTVTAALITTIMFAAAITVPGGNNQDSGIPIFTSKTTFTIFAVSDAISLLSSVSSLVMFLSILTARFAEQDFLFKLPTKLIIGLITLFISTTTMIIAFGATMFLVFGKSDTSVLVHIAIWSCLPIAFFMKFHFPLVADLISATYGPSVFGKKSDKPFP